MASLLALISSEEVVGDRIGLCMTYGSINTPLMPPTGYIKTTLCLGGSVTQHDGRTIKKPESQSPVIKCLVYKTVALTS